MIFYSDISIETWQKGMIVRWHINERGVYVGVVTSVIRQGNRSFFTLLNENAVYRLRFAGNSLIEFSMTVGEQ